MHVLWGYNGSDTVAPPTRGEKAGLWVIMILLGLTLPTLFTLWVDQRAFHPVSPLNIAILTACALTLALLPTRSFWAWVEAHYHQLAAERAAHRQSLVFPVGD